MDERARFTAMHLAAVVVVLAVAYTVFELLVGVFGALLGPGRPLVGLLLVVFFGLWILDAA